MTDAPPAAAKLWDLPTRITHWALVVLILVSWLTGGENMQVHRWSGYGVIGLLVFRLYWGFFGSESARFTHFVKGPGATVGYLKTMGQRTAGDLVGHSPVGAVSVVLLLLVMLLQVSLGLFASDIDGIESGPLSHLVDFDTSRLASDWHELTFRVLQALVVLHIAAIAFYAIWKRQNLITAMITGKRVFSGPAPSLKFAPVWSFVIGVVIAVAVAWLLARGLKLPKF